MKMMAMGGLLLPNESCVALKWVWMEDGVQCLCRYRFLAPYDWHYKFCHVVDDHNNLRHAILSIEHTITTMHWEICVFSFLLVVSEVNAYLAYWFFCKPDPFPTLQQFCHKLGWDGSL